MKRLLLCITLTSTINLVYGQDYKYQEQHIVKQIESPNWSFPVIDDFDGSYQFIVKTKKQFLITTETKELIESSRKDNEDVILELSSFLAVEILSKNKINASNFTGFQTSYIIK